MCPRSGFLGSVVLFFVPSFWVFGVCRSVFCALVLVLGVFRSVFCALVPVLGV